MNKNNLQYEQQNQIYKIINYNTSTMIAQIGIYEKDKFIKNQKIPFAQLPKKIKKLLKG
jgi:hypothetical protein